MADGNGSLCLQDRILFLFLNTIFHNCLFFHLGSQTMGSRSSISQCCGAPESCQTNRILCCGWRKRDSKTTCL